MREIQESEKKMGKVLANIPALDKLPLLPAMAATTNPNEKQKMTTTPKLTAENFQRIARDVNGNPRYHLPASFAEEKSVRKIGGVKYRGKRYGAGWVFQSHALQGEIDALNASAQAD